MKPKIVRVPGKFLNFLFIDKEFLVRLEDKLVVGYLTPDERFIYVRCPRCNPIDESKIDLLEGRCTNCRLKISDMYSFPEPFKRDDFFRIMKFKGKLSYEIEIGEWKFKLENVSFKDVKLFLSALLKEISFFALYRYKYRSNLEFYGNPLLGKLSTLDFLNLLSAIKDNKENGKVSFFLSNGKENFFVEASADKLLKGDGWVEFSYKQV